MEPPSPRAFSILFDLPLEIFQHMTSFLAPSDLTCLALTCTGLWSFVTEDVLQGFRRKDIYWMKQRERLLLELAGDSADMVYCDNCLKLQPLHCGRALTVSNKWIRPPCQHLATHVSICKHFSITREMLELVLKFHRAIEFKPSQTSDPFAHTCTWRTSGSGSAEFTLEVASKVIEGDLYVKVIYDVDLKLDLKSSFSIPSMRGKGCLHSGMWLKKKCACALRHATKDEARCPGCIRAQRCAYCDTLFLVSATKNSTTSLHLQVRAYRCLGGGQPGFASSEHAWVAQTRPLSLAKRQRVPSNSSSCSLEDIFEQGIRKRLVSGLARRNHSKAAKDSLAARLAFHEKYWRPCAYGSDRGYYMTSTPFD